MKLILGPRIYNKLGLDFKAVNIIVSFIRSYENNVLKNLNEKVSCYFIYFFV